ncbi:MAG: ispD [Frankiales bacterium]|nr:ispD [Frankiales bacterium]
MSVAVIVVAAGSGLRLGAAAPKAYVEVGGRSILEWAVRAMSAHVAVTEIVIVTPQPQLEQTAAADWASGCAVVAGGVERHDSVRAGLSALSPNAHHVLVHDAARPFVPSEVLERVIDALLAGAPAVIPALAVTDTVKRVQLRGSATVVSETLPRQDLVAVQTPQGFTRAALESAHRTRSQSVTDDASLIEQAGGEVVVVLGSPDSFKITTPHDLVLAEALSRRLSPRPSR